MLIKIEIKILLFNNLFYDESYIVFFFDEIFVHDHFEFNHKLKYNEIHRFFIIIYYYNLIFYIFFLIIYNL